MLRSMPRGPNPPPGARAVARVAALSLLAALALGGCRSEEPDDSAFRAARAEARGAEPARAAEAPPAEDGVAHAQAPGNPPPTGTPAPDPRLLRPAAANEQAPERYTVELTTTEGPILIDVTRAWAPLGADRFYNLVKIGFFEDMAFFRVIEGFMAQTGLHGDPRVNRAWRTASIQDDPVRQSNTRDRVTFATSGANSRTTQFFINFGDNSRLDGMGFAPFGQVRDMRAVDALHAGYGEGAPRGRGPSQGRIQSQGNAYLRQAFPELDYIRSARIVSEGGQ